MMKHELVRYDAYKDSGVEWLDEVPEYWKISRIKEKGSVKARVGWKALKASEYVDDGFAFLSTPNIKNKDIDFKNVNCITYERYVESPEIMLKEDDILLAKDGSTLGIVNIVTYIPRETTVNSSIGVLRFDKTVFNKYLFYQIESKYIQDKIQLKKGGMGVPHLFQQDINNFIILTPPLPEQTAIATYLDTKTEQIDHKLDLLTQKATQYGKLKQSLINETVTRGLDKSVAMKDSGVEWLGDVPEHWTTLRVKDTVIKIGNGVTPKGGSEVYTDVGIPFIRSQNVYDDGLHIGDVSFISDEIHRDMKGSQLKEGDILINITGASIGRTCVVPIELGIANINQHVAFLRTKYWFNTTYISLFLKSPFIKKYIQFEQNGASKEAFNLTQIANIPIVVPNVEEQTAIATYLDTKTTHIDRIIETINAQIEKLKELRKTLINDVVTGKIKVVE